MLRTNYGTRQSFTEVLMAVPDVEGVRIFTDEANYSAAIMIITNKWWKTKFPWVFKSWYFFINSQLNQVVPLGLKLEGITYFKGFHPIVVIYEK